MSAVLLRRGGDVVNDLERQRVTASPSAFKAETPCVAAGFTWSDNGTPADDSGRGVAAMSAGHQVASRLPRPHRRV